MAYKVKFDGDKEMEVGDLPIDTLQAIADEEGLTWVAVMETHPALNIRLYRRVVDACAIELGIESPTAQVRTGKNLIDAAFGDEAIIEEVTSVEDRPMGDGNPTTAGEQDGVSSPTSPADTDGPPTLSEDNEPTTS